MGIVQNTLNIIMFLKMKTLKYRLFMLQNIIQKSEYNFKRTMCLFYNNF
jgi:hypothetical protein